MKVDPSKISFADTHKLMIGSIVPRPIAFVSTISKEGKNNIALFHTLMESVQNHLQSCLHQQDVAGMVRKRYSYQY